jgi:sialate O-acetylesterase
MKRKLINTAIAVLFLGLSPLRADVTLPAIFSDHMVLQSDAAVPVWGWAEPGEQITVSIAGQTKTATADAGGNWKLALAPLKAGEALTMTVKGKNSITIQDVVVGEVWLCSGQSNMAMTVNRAKDFDAEKAAATLPLIRQFREQSGGAATPQAKGQGKWELCSPETVGSFSATAYFFGLNLHKKLNVPVGLINSSVGGTPVEAWTSLDAQKKIPELQPMIEAYEKSAAAWDPAKAQETYEKQLAAFKAAAAKAKAANKPLRGRPPRKPGDPKSGGKLPSSLFNGKISPLIPYAIRGAIWYQGEANAKSLESGKLYATQLAALIKDWRTRWGEGDFPFAWVQLPDYKAPQKEAVEDDGWPSVRESMLKTLALPNTGMAIAMGTGEAGNIHPQNKQAVGLRLASWALADVYKKPGFASCGPLPSGSEIKRSEIVVTFSHTDGGLIAEGGELKGFAIAGADKKWVRATAKISGATIIVSSPDVKEPKAVRYAWANNPDCNLQNGAGIPASPFRTDNW